MSGEGLIASIVILLLGIVYLALPFVRAGRSSAVTTEERERLKLIAAYERALMTVRDLDDDYAVGKLPEETYATERTRWTEHGAMLLELLEVKGDKQPAKRRKAVETPPAALPDDDAVEAAIAAYVRAREQVKVGEKG